jgi:hypothetical protein
VLAGFVTNFLMNRIWAFGSSSAVGKQSLRYITMAVGNWVGTVLLVGGLVKLGLFYLLARALVLVVLSVVNYLGYKHWVFRAKWQPDPAGCTRRRRLRDLVCRPPGTAPLRLAAAASATAGSP